MKKIYFIIAIIGLISKLYASPFPNNFRIYPSAVTQTEPVSVIHPLNPNIMFVSAVTINTSNGFKSEGVYFSTNGGMNWFGSDTCKAVNLLNHGGDPGVAIDNNGVFVLTHIGSVFAGVYTHYSTNMGNNWSNAYTITSQLPEDKGTLCSDNSPSSPYFGRLYFVWVNFVTPYPVLMCYSTNGAQSWTSPLALNSPPLARCSGGYIETSRDGKVYVTWAGVLNSSPFPEDFAGFAYSTNGGQNWTVNQNIFDMSGINGTLPEKGNIRVNGLPVIEVDKSGGSRDGWIYIVTGEKNLSPAGSDPDIILHRSTNNGQTWSAGIRVNQDAVNNGKIQYFPSIEVDSTGGVNILYYDDRNTSQDSAEVYLARSEDGGNTWREFVVSSHRFKPKPIPGGAAGYQGDHISLISSGNKLFAFWMDDYSGLYQIWECIIDIGTINIKIINSEIPEKFFLYQNYPNPFNPFTKINFDIPSLLSKNSDDVVLRVFNILGKEITTLVRGKLSSGKYSVEWNASNMPSGIYYYRLETGDYSSTKKMVLIK